VYPATYASDEVSSVLSNFLANPAAEIVLPEESRDIASTPPIPSLLVHSTSNKNPEMARKFLAAGFATTVTTWPSPFPWLW